MTAGTSPPVPGTGGFEPGLALWLARQGNLRNVVRQHLVATQLADALRDLLPQRPLTVLDVGAGQGTQALRLARAGHHVTAVDASAEMLAPLEAELAEDEEARRQVTVQVADVLDLAGHGTVATHDLDAAQAREVALGDDADAQGSPDH